MGNFLFSLTLFWVTCLDFLLDFVAYGITLVMQLLFQHLAIIPLWLFTISLYGTHQMFWWYVNIVVNFTVFNIFNDLYLHYKEKKKGN